MRFGLTQEDIFRYARHLTIPEVGLEGQQKLKNASVLVVGAGGLGSPIALYLAGAGIGRIGLVDFDVVDASNLQRQVIHDSQHLNVPKVESAKERMLALNPLIQVEIFNETFNEQNAEKLVESYDIVLDGSDNLATRYLINDICVLLGKPYIYGSVYQFEGQVAVFDARRGPCYRCIFKDPPPAESMPFGVQLGVFGALPGTIGTIQVAEAIKLIVGTGEPLIGYLVLYDALNVNFHKLQVAKDPQCKVCGSQPSIHSLIDHPQDYKIHGIEPLHDSLYIEPVFLNEILQSGTAIQLIDVRSVMEQKISAIKNARLIPLGQLSTRLTELDNLRPIVLFSREDQQSAYGAQILLNAGFRDVKVLRGGINAWARQIDKTIFQY